MVVFGEIDLGFSGALRTAATVVSDDPIFGLFAYGGDLKKRRQHDLGRAKRWIANSLLCGA